MSTMPLLLQGLTPREAINDALARAETSFDAVDRKLFETTVTDDFYFEMGPRRMDKDQLWEFVKSKDTTHFATSIRIHVVPNASTAIMTFTGLAQHYSSGKGSDFTAPYLFAGGLNELELVKDQVDGEEVWKIKVWKMDRKWWQGDVSVLH